MKKLLRILELTFQPIQDFGKFILTKWNRNYFFLLIGAVIVLKITQTVNPVSVITAVMIASTIAILSILKDIGNSKNI